MTGDTNDAIYLMFGRTTDKYDTLDEALWAAWARDEWSDDDWWDKIEAISNGGAVQTIDRYSPEYRAIAAQATANQRERDKVNPPRPFIGNIRIDGQVFESLYEGDDPDVKLDELRPHLGDRVDFDPAVLKRYR